MKGEQVRVTFDGTPVRQFIVADSQDAPVPFLTDGDAVYGTKRTLGLSWMPSYVPEVAGGAVDVKADVGALTRFYASRLAEAGVAPECESEPGILAYISDHAEVVLVRSISGDKEFKMVTVKSKRLAGKIYAVGTTQIRAEGNDGKITFELGENQCAILTK